MQKIEAWWPLPLTAWTVIERVYEKEGIRGLLAGYPSTLAGAIAHRMLSLCLDTSCVPRDTRWCRGDHTNVASACTSSPLRTT